VAATNACQTYRKGKIEACSGGVSRLRTDFANGEKQTMKLAERGVWLGGNSGSERFANWRGGTRRQLSARFQKRSPAHRLQMFTRWSQENWSNT